MLDWTEADGPLVHCPTFGFLAADVGPIAHAHALGDAFHLQALGRRRTVFVSIRTLPVGYA